MDVSIDFESVEPPPGRACRVANGEWLQFAGWLDLIGALERLLEATTLSDVDPVVGRFPIRSERTR